MFPIMETMAKYGTTHYDKATPESIADSLEYIYVDDPKDGNDSSADDNNVKIRINANERNSAYTSRSLIDYESNRELLRTQSAKCVRSLENEKEENVKSSDEDEAYFSLPWRLLPSKVLEDLEFYKNAGKVS